MEGLGAIEITAKDETGDGIRFFLEIFDRIHKNGPPILGLNVLMGDSTKEKLKNI